VAGRIDFYIASKKWGIEITWDGNRLQQHSDRFGTSGAYGQWLASGEMSDYILLDCRSTKPVKRHSSQSSLLLSGILTKSCLLSDSKLVSCSLRPNWTERDYLQ